MSIFISFCYFIYNYILCIRNSWLLRIPGTMTISNRSLYQRTLLCHLLWTVCSFFLQSGFAVPVWLVLALYISFFNKSLNSNGKWFGFLLKFWFCQSSNVWICQFIIIRDKSNMHQMVYIIELYCDNQSFQSIVFNHYYAWGEIISARVLDSTSYWTEINWEGVGVILGK